MEHKNYTISIYAENNVGLLSRVSAIFLKRHINIDSLNTSMSEIENIFRFVIVAKLSEEQVKKIVKQIEKQIEEAELKKLGEDQGFIADNPVDALSLIHI